MTPKGWLVCSAFMSAAWPASAFPQASQEVFGARLADLEDRDVLAAVHSLADRLKFLPSIAEIRSAAIERRRARLLEEQSRAAFARRETPRISPPPNMLERLRERMRRKPAGGGA